MKIYDIQVQIKNEHGARYTPQTPYKPNPEPLDVEYVVCIILQLKLGTNIRYRAVRIPRGLNLSELEQFKEYCLRNVKNARYLSDYVVMAKVTEYYMISNSPTKSWRLETELPANTFFL